METTVETKEVISRHINDCYRIAPGRARDISLIDLQSSLIISQIKSRRRYVRKPVNPQDHQIL